MVTSRESKKCCYKFGCRSVNFATLEEFDAKYDKFKKIWLNQKHRAQMRNILEDDTLFDYANYSNFMTYDAYDFANLQYTISCLYMIYVNIHVAISGMNEVTFIDSWMFRSFCLSGNTLWIVQILLLINLNLCVFMSCYGCSTWQREPLYFAMLRAGSLFFLSIFNALLTLADVFLSQLGGHFLMYQAKTDEFSMYLGSIGIFGPTGVNATLSAGVAFKMIFFIIFEIAFCLVLAWYYFNEVQMTFEYFDCLTSLNDPWLFMDDPPETVKIANR